MPLDLSDFRGDDDDDDNEQDDASVDIVSGGGGVGTELSAQANSSPETAYVSLESFSSSEGVDVSLCSSPGLAQSSQTPDTRAYAQTPDSRAYAQTPDSRAGNSRRNMPVVQIGSTPQRVGPPRKEKDENHKGKQASSSMISPASVTQMSTSTASAFYQDYQDANASTSFRYFISPYIAKSSRMLP
jgi:hypothetical protein